MSLPTPYGHVHSGTINPYNRKKTHVDDSGGGEGAMSKIMSLADSWSRSLGLNQCLEMAICDAHANFRSYGIVALPVILMIPG